MQRNSFEGWYFKHQCGDSMIAFIPGRTKSGAFIQMISNEGAKVYKIPNLTVGRNIIKGGNCVFTGKGCKIDLPDVSGSIIYGKFTPLESDIMGFFSRLPMECRHKVISMGHSLKGELSIFGKKRLFNGGMGYIEKDSGISFPRSYLWIQCNSFNVPCSVMLSVAEIPFCGFSFTGCICAIIYNRREYRLATYNGVRINHFDGERIILTQGRLKLDIAIKPNMNKYGLKSPVNGSMTGTVHEYCNAEIAVRLWEHGRQIINLTSRNAAYEYLPGKVKVL